MSGRIRGVNQARGIAQVEGRREERVVSYRCEGKRLPYYERQLTVLICELLHKRRGKRDRLTERSVAIHPFSLPAVR